jgi:hypothetical protein
VVAKKLLEESVKTGEEQQFPVIAAVVVRQDVLQGEKKIAETRFVLSLLLSHYCCCALFAKTR